MVRVNGTADVIQRLAITTWRDAQADTVVGARERLKRLRLRCTPPLTIDALDSRFHFPRRRDILSLLGLTFHPPP